MNLVIAIDGPAASGKSTVARLVAARLGGVYINTGDMYRTVTWIALGRGINPAAQPEAVAALLPELDLEYRLGAERRPVLWLGNAPVPAEKIRAPEVAAAVSQVAKIAAVRDWMLERQRAARAVGTLVMEGRDIGTVVFPETPHKFFVTASPEVRARRRLAQAGETPDGATVESVAAEIAERDRIDSTRAVAPLRPAPDAVLVNTDAFTAEQVADLIAGTVRKKSGSTAG